MKFLKIVLIIFSMFMTAQVSAQKSEKKIKNKFKKINKDGNDFISQEEWKDFYKEKKTKKGEPYNFKRVFLGYDKNDDKKITVDEMLKGFDKELAKTRMKALKKAKKN